VIERTGRGTRRERRRVRRRRRREKLASIITNEIIIFELCSFLDASYADGAGSVLDLGAGSKPYAPLYEPFFDAATSLDVEHSPHDTSGVSVIASADSIPAPDASFDCLICTEVLEHCPDPRAVLGEIHRVLKPGGRAFLTTPFFTQLHEMPYDFYRYTPPALEMLASGQGLTVTSLRPRGEYVAVTLKLVQLPVTKLWQWLSRMVGVNLYHPLNPLVFVSIVAPQRLYFTVWRRIREREAGRTYRAYRKLTYYTLGYVTTLQRPEAGR
jgi:SAM-dependent methyltransferase